NMRCAAGETEEWPARSRFSSRLSREGSEQRAFNGLTAFDAIQQAETVVAFRPGPAPHRVPANHLRGQWVHQSRVELLDARAMVVWIRAAGLGDPNAFAGESSGVLVDHGRIVAQGRMAVHVHRDDDIQLEQSKLDELFELRRPGVPRAVCRSAGQHNAR